MKAKKCYLCADNQNFSMSTKAIFLLLFLLLNNFCLFSQEKDSLSAEKSKETLLLGSPYHAISWHLQHLSTQKYEPEQAALALAPDNSSPEQRKDWAIKLYQIYTGGGFYANYKKIPSDTSYKDTAGRFRFIPWKLHPEIYLEKKGKNWFYSTYTLHEIARIHAETYPLGAAFLLNFIPKWGNNLFLGLYVWQILGLLILFVVAFIIFKLLDILFRFLIRRISRTKIGIYYTQEVKTVARPLSLFFVTYFINALIPVLQLPLLLSGIMVFLLKVAKPTFWVLTCYNLVDLFAIVGSKVAENTDTTLDNQLVPLIRKTVKLMIGIFGTIFVLRNIDVDVMTLLAGLSIGGLAIALAAQDSVKNFLGSVTILLDSTFQIGDHIEADGKMGVVEEVGFRSTRIRTYDGAIITIPNAKIVDSSVLNNGPRKFRKFMPKIMIGSNTPLPAVEAFLADIQSLIDKHTLTHNEGNRVYISHLNSKSAEVYISVLFDETRSNESQIRQEVVMGIMALAQKHKIELQ